MKKLLFLLLILGITEAQSQIVLDTITRQDNWYRAWSQKINPNMRLVADSLNYFLSLAHQMGANSGWQDQGTWVGLASVGDTVSIGTVSRTAKLNVAGDVSMTGLKFPDGSYQVTAGGAPAFPHDATKFLRGDSSWATVGIIPAFPHDSTQYLRGDSTWATVGIIPDTLHANKGVVVGTPTNAGAVYIYGAYGGAARLLYPGAAANDINFPAASGMLALDNALGGYPLDVTGIGNGKMLIFNGTKWVVIDSSALGTGGGGTGTWGGITGTWNNQTDNRDSVRARITKYLPSGQIFVGGVGDTATRVAISGDVTIDNTGATSIGANKVGLTQLGQTATGTFMARGTGGTGNWAAENAATVRAMLSINNVENKALSTWAGDGNVFTNGTWHATPIGKAYGGTGATTGNAAYDALLGIASGNGYIYRDPSGVYSLQSPSGTGSVTSVGVSTPAEFVGSVVNPTTTPVLTIAWNNATANLGFFGPVSGGPGTPGFRSMVDNDVPSSVARRSDTMTYVESKAAVAAARLSDTGRAIVREALKADKADTNTYIETPSAVATALLPYAPLASPTITGTPAFNLGSDATGDMYYRDSGGKFHRLGIGAAGYRLGVSAGLASWNPSDTAGDASKFNAKLDTSGAIPIDTANAGAYAGHNYVWYDRTDGFEKLKPSFAWSYSGQSAAYDSLRFVAGANITITQTGNTITIAALPDTAGLAAWLAFKAPLASPTFTGKVGADSLTADSIYTRTIRVNKNESGNIDGSFGIRSSLYQLTTKNTGSLYGIRSDVGQSSDTLNSGKAFEAYIASLVAGRLTEGIGFHVPAAVKTGTATIGSIYGVKVEAQTVGDNNYAVFTVGATQSYFGGPVRVGGAAAADSSLMAIGGHFTGGLKVDGIMSGNGSGITALNDSAAGRYETQTMANTARNVDSLRAIVREGLKITGTRSTIQTKGDTSAIFVFGAGGGNAGDTTVFTTSTIYGSFYNKGTDTIHVTSLYCVMQHGIGTDTLGIQVAFNDTLNVGAGAGGTNLLAATFPVNSITAGNEQTTITTATIPPGNWVWLKTPTVVAGRKPVYLSVTLSGYRSKP